jgi:hypothetical protein
MTVAESAGTSPTVSGPRRGRPAPSDTHDRDASNVLGGQTRPRYRIESNQSDVADDVAPFGSDAPGFRSDQLVVPIVRVPPAPRLDRGAVLQKWEGRVQKLTRDGFIALLTDLTGFGPDEEAEFDEDDVSSVDRPLIKPGAVFYWSLGYRDSTTGQRSRESVIRFRRLPQWSQRDRDEAAARASRWKSGLRWGE